MYKKTETFNTYTMKHLLLIPIFLLVAENSNAQLKIFKKKDKEVAATESAKTASADSTKTPAADKEEKKSLKDKLFGKKKKDNSEENAAEEIVAPLPEGTLNFSEFKSAYQPMGIRSHPRTILTIDILEAKTGANLVRDAVRTNNADGVLRSLANGSREKMMEFLNKLTMQEIIAAFKLLDKDWAIELAWYTNVKIYNALAPNVDAIKNFRAK